MLIVDTILTLASIPNVPLRRRRKERKIICCEQKKIDGGYEKKEGYNTLDSPHLSDEPQSPEDDDDPLFPLLPEPDPLPDLPLLPEDDPDEPQPS